VKESFKGKNAGKAEEVTLKRLETERDTRGEKEDTTKATCHSDFLGRDPGGVRKKGANGGGYWRGRGGGVRAPRNSRKRDWEEQKKSRNWF